jgi:hypothetical protein
MKRNKELGLNRRKAIKLKCFDCSGYKYKEVRNCHHLYCPLFPYRMGKGEQNPKERDRAIRFYCMWCCLDQPTEIILCGSGDCPLHDFRGYNRVKKMPDSHEKTSPTGIRRNDFPSVIPEPLSREKIVNEMC